LKNTPVNIMRVEQRYLVRNDGKVNLPMIGTISLAGKTLQQSDSILSAEYTKYYFGVFAITKVLNKRAIVLGPTAASTKVIPLENDNITVLELLALAGGMPDNGKANNLRLIRGDTKNPDVQIIDLSTIEGMRKASMNVEPNDVLYIEPVKRILPQTLQDIYPLISLALSILSLIILVGTINRTN
jgi:polysaccharide export outer membrane protein